MELFKNIYFNTDKLTPFFCAKISYTGKFFDDKSTSKVFLHYSFEKNWQNSKDIEMTRSEIGFQVEVELTDSKTFDICFFNDKNEWDNNNGENYSFTIEKVDLCLMPIDNEYSLISPSKLHKFYLWKKRLKINIYKAITFLPRLIKGRYKRKITSN